MAVPLMEVDPLLAEGWRRLDEAWPGQLWMHSTRWGVSVTTPWRMPSGAPVAVVLMEDAGEVVVCDMAAAATWLYLRDPDRVGGFGRWRDEVIGICMELGCDPVDEHVQCWVTDEVCVESAVMRVSQAVLRIASLPLDPAVVSEEVRAAEEALGSEQRLESCRSAIAGYAADVESSAALLVAGLIEAVKLGSVDAAAQAVGLECDELEALVSGSMSLSTKHCMRVGIGTSGAWPPPRRADVLPRQGDGRQS